MDVFWKDPDAVLDYMKDWSDWLGTDKIASSSWAVDSDDLVIDSHTNTDTTATVVLSGGVAKKKYRVTCSIVTVSGLEEDDSMIVIGREN